MQDDDRTIGKILSRQQMLHYLGAAGATSLGLGGVARAADSRVLIRPEAMEGPYFLDEKLDRSDIRVEPTSNQPVAGTPLSIALNIIGVEGSRSRPLTDTYVHLWHCDAAGEYSGVDDRMIGFNTQGKAFLRGYQKTDANGQVRFQTIYPGWYLSRALHVHFKVLTMANGRPYEFTSQLYFDDSLSDKVLAQGPYAGKGPRKLRNNDDDLYKADDGRQMTLALADDGRGGFRGTFDVGMDLRDEKAGRPDRWLLDPRSR